MLYGPTETTVCATHERRRSAALSHRRSVVRSGTRGLMFWTDGLSLFLRVLSGELYIAGVGSGAGLSEPCGADGGAVCGGPAWSRLVHGGAGGADVPDRGPGAVACGRCAGVFGARGRAGEAARVPDRAWRDRGGAAAAGGVSQAAVIARGRRAVRAGGSGWSAMWWRRRVRRLEPCGACVRRCRGSLPDYMVPSALVVLERSAADAERQARPARAACAGACARRRRSGRRGRRRRRSCAGCLPRCWGSRGSASTTTSSSWAATASCRSSW